jgi:hypothetical protein
MSESAAVADTMSAVSSVSGAVEAVANAPDTISNLFVAGSKLIYGTGYAAAFVITFPLALICGVIPKRNGLVQGMIDGSQAARDKAQCWIG